MTDDKSCLGGSGEGLSRGCLAPKSGKLTNCMRNIREKKLTMIPKIQGIFAKNSPVERSLRFSKRLHTINTIIKSQNYMEDAS